MKLGISYIAGLLFGLGICISGMANPAKIVNFFDVFGTWDPSLALVMGGGLAVALPGYRWIFGRGTPALSSSFHLPAATRIDRKLIIGSGMFGVGWGIAGFCPGGALPVVSTFNPTVLVFVSALMFGIWFARSLQTRAPDISAPAE